MCETARTVLEDHCKLGEIVADDPTVRAFGFEHSGGGRATRARRFGLPGLLSNNVCLILGLSHSRVAPQRDPWVTDSRRTA